MTTDMFGFGRADLLASFALFYDDPAKINMIEERITEVTPELIQRTAKEYLRPGSQTVLSLVPKGSGKTDNLSTGS
jgi:predicted Zn-dependent peptidase